MSANEYELGHGFKVNDKLHIGGYFSTDYEKSNEKRQFRLDDVAILGYGELFPKFTYLFEFEAAPFYAKNYTDDTTTKDTTFHYERFYVNYSFSDALNLRAGKQITPIGYWNLEPINVLRDTSSNPLYSKQIFPKLFTGIDLYGYLDSDNELSYHLFMQKNNDMDADYINIKNSHFFGLSLEYEPSMETSFGASAGEFITNDIHKHVRYVQANAKYDSYPYKFQTEIAYSGIDNKETRQRSYKLGGYAQGLYNFNMKHAAILRYEYFDDKESNKLHNIGVFGYSYRPLYAVSIKGEYQWNSDSDANKFIISLSVLF